MLIMHTNNTLKCREEKEDSLMIGTIEEVVELEGLSKLEDSELEVEED